MPIDGATGLSRDSSDQRHHAGIQVRQQPGLLEHADRHRAHVVQRRVVAALVQPLPGLVPARLRPIAEREKRFLATQFSAAAGDVEDLVGLHEHAEALGAQLAGNGDEGAVVAGVAAQMGDGDEHLARVADRQPAVGSAPARRRQARRRAPARRSRTDRPGRRRGRSWRSPPRRRSAPPRRGRDAAHAAKRRRLGAAGFRWDHRAGQSGAALGVQSHSRVTLRWSMIIRASHILKHRRLPYRPQ